MFTPQIDSVGILSFKSISHQGSESTYPSPEETTYVEDKIIKMLRNGSMALLDEYKSYIQASVKPYLDSNKQNLLSLILEEPFNRYKPDGSLEELAKIHILENKPLLSDTCIHILKAGVRKGKTCDKKTIKGRAYCSSHCKITCIECSRKLSYSLYCKVHIYPQLCKNNTPRISGSSSLCSSDPSLPHIIIRQDNWKRFVHKPTLLCFNERDEVCGAVISDPSDPLIYDLTEDDYECICVFGFSLELKFLAKLELYLLLKRIRAGLNPFREDFWDFYPWYTETGELIHETSWLNKQWCSLK